MKLRKFRIVLPQRWHVRRMRVRKREDSRHAARSSHTGRLGRMALCAALVLSAVWVALAMIGAHLRPIIGQLASAKASYLASAAIHEAIARRLETGGYTYDRIVAFEKDAEGRITALKTDMLVVNRMKADITGDVLEAIQDIGIPELSIPLGNLFGGELFSGRGPLIPVKIVPVGTAGAEFSNVFSAAGINQTRHQIVMSIHADLSVLMPGNSVGISVAVQFNVAETVIVGTVPDTYASFGNP